jgi:hypothetical protein
MRIAAVLIITLMSAFTWAQGGGGGSPQSGGPPSGQGPSSSGASVPQPSVGSQTYSIEGDILGYKALQSDAEAIACDIASSLGWTPKQDAKVTPASPATKSPCAKPVTVSDANILIISSADQTLANYQLWRLGLLTVDTLQSQADGILPKRSSKIVLESFSGVEAGITSTLAIIQTIAGFFVSNESVAGIQGTPQDQALVDAVSRHLRVMGVKVFVPNTYSPYSLTGLAYDQSPFLFKLRALQVTRRNLSDALSDKTLWDKNSKQIDDDKKTIGTLTAQDAANQKQGKPVTNTQEIARLKDEVDTLSKVNTGLADKYTTPIKDIPNIQISSMIQNIDSFMSALIASNVSAMGPGSGQNQGQQGPTSPNPASTPGAPTTNPPAANVNITNNSSNPSNQAPSPSIPPIVSILYGDGIARILGATVSAPTPSGDEIKKWKILSLKEFEIGATVTSRANLFGTKVFYSGGAIATYILYDLTGNVYCSANVFDYGGRIKGKDFDAQFRSSNIDPGAQLLFQRGQCPVFAQ